MNLTNEEAQSLLQLLADEMRQAGLLDVHHEIIGDPEIGQTPAQILKNYLYSLMVYLKKHSKHQVDFVLSQSAEFIKTETGDQLQDIIVDLTHAEQTISGIESFKLSDLPDYSPVVEMLDEILHDVQGEQES